LSIDRSLISKRVSYGIRPPLRSLVPPPLVGSHPPTWPSYNPEKAQRLFRQAGYCNGATLVLPLTFRSNVPTDKLFALTWQAQLQRDLGTCVTLEINGVESTTAYRQLEQAAFPMILLDWIGDYPDPDIYLAPMLGCSQADGSRCLAGNAAAAGSFWSAPGLQKQLERSESIGGEQRQQLLQTLQKRAAQGGAYIPLWHVAPRAWAQPQLQTPQFDGTGRVILQSLAHR
jgi:peptide/nickel transport system substrate-binding protein